jgi:putative FmdB family regulatory protein
MYRTSGWRLRIASCGRLVEVIQKFSDPPLKKCSECGGKLQRVPSAPAFHLKGSGWYKTDYAPKDGGKKDSSSSSKSEKSEKSETSEKKDSAGETKAKESPKTSSKQDVDSSK